MNMCAKHEVQIFKNDWFCHFDGKNEQILSCSLGFLHFRPQSLSGICCSKVLLGYFNPRTAGVSGRTRHGGGGGRVNITLLTREPAAVARLARRQSKALKETFLREFRIFY